jgi:hypothetical protein
MSELHLMSMLALTQLVGIEFVLKAMPISRERNGSFVADALQGRPISWLVRIPEF